VRNAGRIPSSADEIRTTFGARRRHKPPARPWRAFLKPAVDEAVAKCPQVEHVLVVRRTGQDVAWTDGRDVWWNEITARQSAEHTPEAFEAEHPLFILYTSGTTGKPKGILHTSGGYLAQAGYTHHAVFDLKPETDVYWCTADIGWVTGHSYIVYGPLADGATQVMYEGTPDTPHQGRFWEIVQNGVTGFVHENGRRLSMSAGGTPMTVRSMFTTSGGTRAPGPRRASCPRRTATPRPVRLPGGLGHSGRNIRLIPVGDQPRRHSRPGGRSDVRGTPPLHPRGDRRGSSTASAPGRAGLARGLAQAAHADSGPSVNRSASRLDRLGNRSPGSCVTS
jgi:hypothetical protein